MYRKVIEQIKAQATSDGDGVKLLRVFGGQAPERFDPFLLLDEFGSHEVSDYIGGFPSHPHRGFQTVTYMLEGKMEHRDHLGNVGLLSDGAVQWMSAGKGVIHSEMPKQTEGRMRGFQLWVNLASDQKLLPAWYIDIPAQEIPKSYINDIQIKTISGQCKLAVEDECIELVGHKSCASSEIIYLDIAMPKHQKMTLHIPLKTCMLYVYNGEVTLSDKQTVARAQTLNRFNDTGDVDIQTTHHEARFILIAGEPINEPIVQYGPFVMNSMEEIEQAILDYKQGNLTD